MREEDKYLLGMQTSQLNSLFQPPQEFFKQCSSYLCQLQLDLFWTNICPFLMRKNGWFNIWLANTISQLPMFSNGSNTMNFSIDFRKLCAVLFLNSYCISYTHKKSLIFLGKGHIKHCQSRREYRRQTGLNGPHFFSLITSAWFWKPILAANYAFLAYW